MRILVQEVKEASVYIDGNCYSSIGRGFCLFVGFTQGDDEKTIEKMADKISKLRIFPDENGKTNKSLSDVGGAILSVSQFTLYGSVKEGNRPSFVSSLNSEESSKLYALFNNVLSSKVGQIKTGVFHADMDIKLTNDGPFTLWLDSKELVK